MIAGANEQQRKLCCEDPLQGAVAADILAIKQAVDGGQELSSVPTLLPLSVSAGMPRRICGPAYPAHLHASRCQQPHKVQQRLPANNRPASSTPTTPIKLPHVRPSSPPCALPPQHYVDTGVLRQLFTMQMAGGAPSASELSEGTTADVLTVPGHTGAAAAGPVTVGADTGAGPSEAGVGGGDAAAAAGPQPAHALLPPLPQEAAGGGSLPAVWPLQPPAGPPPLLHGCLPLPRPGQLLPQLQPGAEMGLPGLATLPQPPLGAMPATPRQPLMPHMIPQPTQQPQQPYQPQPGSSPVGPNAPGAPPTPPKQNPRIITGPDPERVSGARRSTRAACMSQDSITMPMLPSAWCGLVCAGQCCTCC